MSLLRVMMKHLGYYILMIILLSWFVTGTIQGILITICGAAVFISMFAAIVQLIFDGDIGAGAQRISIWCLRGTAIVTGIAVIGAIGINNIAKLFTCG